MSLIGKNINKIRKMKKLSQNELASTLGVKRSSISAYEEGRANPKIELIIKIAKIFSISIDAFISRELTMDEILNINIDKYSEYGLHHSNSISSAFSFVSQSEMNLFLKEYDKDNYLNSLPKILFPFKTKNVSISFEISELIKNYTSNIKFGDIVLCEETEVKNFNSDGNVTYLIRTKTDFILSQLVILPDNSVCLIDTVSDTEIMIDINEIELFYQIQGIISLNSSDTTDIEKRVNKLEDMVSKMNKYLNPGSYSLDD